ncbi:hypothetical protein R1flu_023650 [Riccia fluitans]|uniref:Uncharacterized protein n=1 Tax=Riccia fluitans TaxID=41844 RepID=A0ABD1XTG0_9MARC
MFPRGKQILDQETQLETLGELKNVGSNRRDNNWTVPAGSVLATMANAWLSGSLYHGGNPRRHVNPYLVKVDPNWSKRSDGGNAR